MWWQNGVLYQIYPRSFQDSGGDGLGDLAGIISRLDYLKDLGVDGLWLSPIYPSPDKDFGYDVADYEAVDPRFGDLAAFDRLAAEAHARGLRVVLDLVFNHTSDQHPWFQAARRSRQDPLRDWYIWRDPGPNGRPPNNWQSAFGGSAWEWDEASGQYYYHAFLKEQPDLNWRNPAVAERLWQAARFWLDRSVDGFRLDVVNAYYKDALFRDNPLQPGRRPYDMQRHRYDRDRPEMLDALRDLRRLLDGYPERMAVGEIMDPAPELIRRYCGDDRLHLAFNFDFTSQPWLPRAFQNAVLTAEALPEDVWPCYVLSNHDLERHVSRFGTERNSDARARVAAAMLLTLRGTPCLYYGEEIGLRSAPIPRSEIQDPVGQRYWPFHPGRDPERTPMPWDGSPQAGFTTGQPWLRLGPDHAARNVAAQAADPGSVLNWYRQLLQLRRASPALQQGAFTALQRRPLHALAYLRSAEAQTMLVGLNFFGWPVDVPLTEALPSDRWRVRLSTHSGDHSRLSGPTLRLEAFEACVLEAE